MTTGPGFGPGFGAGFGGGDTPVQAGPPRVRFVARQNVYEGFEIATPARVAVGDAFPVEIDALDYCAIYWKGGELYSAGEYALPSLATGFAAVTVNGGRSGRREPPWPCRQEALVRDGSLTWRIVPAAMYAISPLSAPSVDTQSGLTVSAVVPEEGTKVLATYLATKTGMHTAVYSATVAEQTRKFRHQVIAT